MNRRCWILIICGLAACAPKKAVVLPETFAGGWHRTGLSPLSDPVDAVPKAAILHGQRAVYEGPGKLDLRLYEMNTPAAALDVVQKWQPVAHTVCFFVGHNYVAVMETEGADSAKVQPVVKELTELLGPS